MRGQALQALEQTDPATKVALVSQLPGDGPFDTGRVFAAARPLPGRPDNPPLVPAQQVPARSVGTLQGRAALLHSIAHIEFNAINLALDILWRFPCMPVAFYRDWLNVAKEEALHFSLLVRHLASLGYAYGDFPAHNGLWEMAERTADDIVARLALVPRTLEARGLDASPVVRDKLLAAGDPEAAAIIDTLLHDEIGHVATGNYWYRFVCEQRGHDPVAYFPVLSERYRAPRLRGPFNIAARLAAGFTQEELNALQAPPASGSPAHP